MSHVGFLIKEAREAKNITQFNLGLKAGFSTGQYISNAERGNSGISLKFAKKICKILEINPHKMRSAIEKDFSEDLRERWSK
jgi:transcriptional regulator with XRE-family HTH domain